jgi:hypothetical protein
MVITFEQWNTCWYVPTIISLDMDYISSNWFAFELCSSNIVSKYLTRFLWTISTGNNRMQNTCPSYYRKLYSSFFIKKNRKPCSNWAGNVPNKKPELVRIIKFSYIGEQGLAGHHWHEPGLALNICASHSSCSFVMSLKHWEQNNQSTNEPAGDIYCTTLWPLILKGIHGPFQEKGIQ